MVSSLFFLYCSIYSLIKSPTSGSRLAVGSSKNNSLGLFISDFAKATDVSFNSQIQADANQALNAGNRTEGNDRAIAARLAAQEQALVNRLNNQ